jgi:hypothetical protein
MNSKQKYLHGDAVSLGWREAIFAREFKGETEVLTFYLEPEGYLAHQYFSRQLKEEATFHL